MIQIKCKGIGFSSFYTETNDGDGYGSGWGRGRIHGDGCGVKPYGWESCRIGSGGKQWSESNGVAGLDQSNDLATLCILANNL